MSNPYQAPASREDVEEAAARLAENQARLAELRARQGQQTHPHHQYHPQQHQQQQYHPHHQYHQQQQYHPHHQYHQQQQYQPQQARQHPQPVYGYADADGDDFEDEEDDDAAMEFFDDMHSAANEKDKQAFEAMLSETEKQASAMTIQTLDAEDLFAACKFGDLATIKDIFEKHSEFLTILKTARDNKGRTALHYAVDSGNVELCSHLVELGLKCDEKDESGITPRDAAVIVGRTNLSSLLGDGRSDAASFFNVAPPRFVVTKPAPKQAPHKKNATWGHTAPVANPARPAVLSQLGDISCIVPRVQANALAHGGPDWSTVPADFGSEQLHGRVHVLTVQNAAGQVDAVTEFAPLGRLCVNGTSKDEPFYVACRAQATKGATRDLVAHSAATMTKSIITFSSRKDLSPVLAPVCYYRWFARVLNADKIVLSDAVNEVFPEFRQFANITRADLIRKHSAPTRVEVAQAWRVATSDDIEGLAFIAKGTANAFDLTFEGSAGALSHFANQTNHLGLFVSGPEGGPTRGFLMQRRNAATGSYSSAVLIATWGPVSAGEVADAVAAIAPDIDVVHCTNVSGIAEDDLRKSKFFELEHEGAYLYVCSSPSASFASGLKPSRVRLPVTM